MEEGSCMVGSGTLSEVLCRRRNEKKKNKIQHYSTVSKNGFLLIFAKSEKGFFFSNPFCDLVKMERQSTFTELNVSPLETARRDSVF